MYYTNIITRVYCFNICYFSYRMADTPACAPATDQVRVYVDGVYDLFHVGHVDFFKRVRGMFDGDVWLIAGVTSERDTEKFKGKTVISAKDRCEMVRQCRYVDEVIEDCPWIIDAQFVSANRIDWVVHDEAPYEMGAGADGSGAGGGGADGDGGDVYAYVKRVGIFKHVDRTHGVSSTDIISRIIRNYNHYLVRNLKRGMSRKDLDLSWWTMFHVIATHKIKTGELLKDATEFAKDVEDNIDVFADRLRQRLRRRELVGGGAVGAHKGKVRSMLPFGAAAAAALAVATVGGVVAFKKNA